MFELLERRADGTTTRLCQHATVAPLQRAQEAVKAKYPTRIFFIQRLREISDEWKQREQRRFNSGEYKPLPLDWITASWWKPDHFAHVSRNFATMVSYTQSPEHGQADRQTRTAPGRYLERVIPPNEHTTLRNSYIRDMVALFLAENSTNIVQFAATADEIERVYVDGPSSCMAHRTRDFNSAVHPTRVYAAGDLQVAYLEDADGCITARALVWPERKIYNRIYGDGDRLAPALTALGYTDAYYARATLPQDRTFYGAQLLKIEEDDGDAFVMPYLDGINGITEHADHFTIGGDDYYACETEGLINRDDREQCARCGDYISGDATGNRVGDDTWCDDCYADHAITCYHCEESFDRGWAEGTTAEDTDDWYCDHCADRRLTQCSHCVEFFASIEGMIEFDSARYCERCARNELSETPCGEVCKVGDEATACDCSVCAPEEPEEEDDALESPRQRALGFDPYKVILKPTSPHVVVPNQLSMIAVLLNLSNDYWDGI